MVLTMGGDGYDVVIVGAGPAGCACGIFLARAGLRVVILEATKHPRHHIGESLLPASMPVLERLGISVAELGRRFQPKFGARFYDPEADELAVFRFEAAVQDARAPAFQVIREEFDLMLADKARAAGCEVREETVVERVEEDAGRVSLRGGDLVEGRFVVDASGREAVVARKRGSLRMNHEFGRLAVYNYFAELPPHDAEDAQFITMYLFDGGWVWLIPLKDDAGGRTSVGVVLREKPAARSHESEGASREETILWRTVAKMPQLEGRLRAGRPTEAYRAIGDYSYTVSEKFGERFVLIGDAAGFLDPIFSSGVHLALASAEEAAAGVIEKLGTGSDEGLSAYAKYMDQGYHVFSSFVQRFYNRDLARNLFFMPNKPPAIHAAITRILAGHVWEAENPILRMLHGVTSG